MSYELWLRHTYSLLVKALFEKEEWSSQSVNGALLLCITHIKRCTYRQLIVEWINLEKTEHKVKSGKMSKTWGTAVLSIEQIKANWIWLSSGKEAKFKEKTTLKTT